MAAIALSGRVTTPRTGVKAATHAPKAARRPPEREPMASELVRSVAHHEAGHAVVGVALGFRLHSVEVDALGGGRAFFTPPPLADRDPWYAVVGAAGPAAERRWLRSEGVTLDDIYGEDGDAGDAADWRRVRGIARASGYPVDDFWRIARWMIEDARIWRACQSLAADLAARLELDGEFASVPGPEALAIMGAHSETATIAAAVSRTSL